MKLEEIIAWILESMDCIAVFGIPCFIMIGCWFVSPAVLIIVYGVDPNMWISTMAQLYPNEFFSISLFVALVIPPTAMTIKMISRGFSSPSTTQEHQP